MKVLNGAVTPEPYLIQPRNEFERQYGKPVLLTDCEIGVILDCLQTSEGDLSTREALFRKLLPLWSQPIPNRRFEEPRHRTVALEDSDALNAQAEQSRRRIELRRAAARS